MLKKLVSYKKLIETGQILKIKIDVFEKDITECSNTYGIPPHEILVDILTVTQRTMNLLLGKINFNPYDFEPTKDTIHRKNGKI